MVPAVRRRSHRLNRCGKARKANNGEQAHQTWCSEWKTLFSAKAELESHTLHISVGSPPSDFRVFCKLKEHLDGRQFSSDDQVQAAVLSWLQDQGAIFYRQGIERLVQRSDKCLQRLGDYVEK
ncbi:hypothetical protein AVEN_216886-1 [Araneus ventricosus]|uniref:Histone-lysine N-methyltransferase SETMAR n=1 Tax=Araneus ventricosus TaxID=182803 RepID=A0A4Y2HSP1_ARAVE|nr:hypothetical protein AVEN_216886-1 [Araneus ventricosus]